jgi:hypothetical protein
LNRETEKTLRKNGQKTRDEFMRKTNIGSTAAACLAVTALMGATASAQIVYDNTSSSLGQRTAEGNAEIGDAVTFAGGPATIAQISFEYFVTPGASGNETAQLFLYSMNGTAGLPGTLLYSSPTFNLVPATSAGFGTATISGISVPAPSQIAWSVAFSGLDTSGNTPESAGLLFYNPPSVGSSPTFDPGDGTQHDYFLKHNVSGWQVLDTPGLIDNLNVRFTAVPEPSTLALLGLGGVVAAGLIRRRK